jgi:hypothetical protein
MGGKKTLLKFFLLKTQLIVHKTRKTGTYDFPCYMFRRGTPSFKLVFPSMVRPPTVGQGLLIVEAVRAQALDASHSVGFLWKSDQPDVETCT